MAQFEGVLWADSQMRYLLNSKTSEMLESRSRIFAVSRSVHYGLFLCFEGIRFFCQRNERGKIEVVFMNWTNNLERFRAGISFNFSHKQQDLVPTVEELESLFLSFFREPSMQAFFEEMADLGAQGYLRPFTVDEEQSIGVDFPTNPSIRIAVCRYDKYLGEPFNGVVLPNLVRVIGINGTGCLKLGVNYLMSVKAVDRARELYPGSASAIFLDDNPWKDMRDRCITEWDSSCCMIALSDNSIIKIPESSLILPSVTIQGVTAVLRSQGITVHERNITYGEFIDKVKAEEIVAVCSIGTAGILNRCHKLFLTDMTNREIGIHESHKGHDLYKTLGNIKKWYWDMYRGDYACVEGCTLQIYDIS